MGRLVAPIAALLLFGASAISHAAWSTDPSVNNPVSLGPRTQDRQCAIPDGQGGVFIVFRDMRDSATIGTSVYAQHLDAQGNRVWAADGMPVTAVAGVDFLPGDNGPVLARDGSGGMFVSFVTAPNRSIGPYWVKIQHLDANGTAVWGDTGISVTAIQSINGRLLEDGSGGVFICWSDLNHRVVVQHLDGAGNALWSPNGVTVVTSLIPQSQWMVPDGSGGVVLVWTDFRASNGDLYAQRVNAGGVILWQPNGVPLCTEPSGQALTSACSDGAGGAIVSWTDQRTGLYKVYAQRVTGSGTRAWSPDGVAVCTADSAQASTRIASDGANGAFVSWWDYRFGPNFRSFLQRVNAAGNRVWADTGVPVALVPGPSQAELLPDGAHGVIACWSDWRTVSNYYLADVYAQRFDAGGAPLWGPNDVLVSGAPGNQAGAALVGAPGGAIVAFTDRRGSTIDVYAQAIMSDGSLGSVTGVGPFPGSNVPRGLAVAPVPARGEVRFSFRAASTGTATLRLFDLQGRMVRSLETRAEAGTTSHLSWDGRDPEGARLRAGVYLARLDGAGEAMTARVVIAD